MNSIQEKSLQLMRDLLSSMDTETFLKELEAIANEEVLIPALSLTSSESFPVIESFVSPEVHPYSFGDLNYISAANDENYSALLAA